MRRTAGYTIIELLVVMAVLGILATAAMPLAELTARRNKERVLREALFDLRHAIDDYKRAHAAGRIGGPANASGYPPALAVLVTGVPDLKNGGQPMYFLRRVPRDPFAPPGSAAEAGWGLRSYASTADNPKPGDDVFDVFSKADGVGMNGVPYREW
jgi:general secretion pathway protein G